MISTTVVKCENSLKNMDHQDHQDHPSQDTVSGWNYNLYANNTLYFILMLTELEQNYILSWKVN